LSYELTHHPKLTSVEPKERRFSYRRTKAHAAGAILFHVASNVAHPSPILKFQSFEIVSDFEIRISNFPPFRLVIGRICGDAGGGL
jgi:hypothetical protein